MPHICWMSHRRSPAKPTRPPDRRIDNDDRLWRIVLAVERDGLHRLAVLYFRSVMSNASQPVDTFDEVPCLIWIV